MPEYVEGELFLVVQGRKSLRYGTWSMDGIKAYKRKPAVAVDEVAMKISLKLPIALFEKPTLEASIHVDGDVPRLELEPATVEDLRNMIATQLGADVELRVLPMDE